MSKYSVVLAGESNYQEAIRACRSGERVQVLHEIGNPYDNEALVVATRNGAKLGYIPRSSWLREAVHNEGKGCSATIKSIATREQGLHGVVIEVELDMEGVDECAYRP